jgi:hypothetical protein
LNVPISSSDSSFSSTFSSTFSGAAAAPPAAAAAGAAADEAPPPEGTEASLADPAAMISLISLPFNSAMRVASRPASASILSRSDEREG